jgi:hypothetical protein
MGKRASLRSFLRKCGRNSFLLSRRKKSIGDESMPCLVPLGAISGSTEGAATMFGTHDWNVDSSKPYGEGGIIIHYSGEKCEAEGYSIVITKYSATSRLIESRLLNPFLENPRI